MTPEYRFTFYNATLSPTGTVVAQPLGWKEASVSLVRDPNYHSLVEFFKGSFIWYGSAREFIRTVEDTEGPDAKIRITIELKFNIGGFSQIFDGTVDVSQIEDISIMKRFYKSVVPIIRDDFWVKLINRAAIPVNLESTTDLDGNARTAVTKTVLPMPSQIIRKRYEGSVVDQILIDPAAWTASDYFQLGMPSEPISEITTKFSLPTGINTTLPASVWTMDEDGEYTFNIRIEMSLDDLRFPIVDPKYMGDYLNWYIRKNDDSPIALTKVNHDNTGVSNVDSTVYTYAGTLTLAKGDEIRLYGDFTAGNPDITTFLIVWETGSDNPSGAAVPTFIEVTANTTTAATEADTYLVKDAAESILSKIIGQNSVVVSDDLDGCVGNNIITRGKHIRGYSYTEKEYSLSFQEWWECMGPLYNLGLGYETVAGVKKIRIERKAYFYNPTPVVFISNVTDLVRTYDLEKIYKSIEIGSEQWSAESESGIDDPQTKRVFDTGLKTIGADLQVLTKAFVASLGIEQTRRNRIEFGKDWKLDENNIIIAVVDDGGWRPEVGADYASITDLLNSDSRINIRHTPAYMLRRWKEWIAGGLQVPGGASLRFRKGEGNYTMTSELDAGQCELDFIDDTVEESGDVAVGSQCTFLPRTYRAKIPMNRTTYDSILANKNRAIGISTANSDYLAMHIMDMDYKIVKGYANVDLLLASTTPINP